MKKRWLSLLMLCCFSVGFVSGCKDEETNNNPISGLNVDGNDVVLKIGDKKYTAEELFGDMLVSNDGAKLIYEKLLKMVVESSQDIDSYGVTGWEKTLKTFEDKVKQTSMSTGVSEDEARKQLLAEEGYSSIDEKKDAYYYAKKLKLIKDAYWEAHKDEFYEDYLNANKPYYVKHVLVKAGYTADTLAYYNNISDTVATLLYKVYGMLADDYKFSYIMNQLSEDTNAAGTASGNTGLGYMMDLNDGYTSTFLHSTFVFDALIKSKQAEIAGLNSDVLSLYASTADEGFNFSVINASEIVALGDYASETKYEDIKAYEKEDGTGSSEHVFGLNSSSPELTRNIIFNQIFNNPGISVIAYDLDENTPKNVKEININGESKKVLTDEHGNIVYVICEKAEKNDKSQSFDELRIHFMTVNVSPFDTFENTNGKNDAKLFFSLNQEKDIDKMVEARTTELTNSGMDAEMVKEKVEEYENKLKSYKTYVDLYGGETLPDRYKYIDELTTKVRTYVRRGISSGAIKGSEEFETYRMMQHYMEEGKISITNETIKNIFNNYVSTQIELINLTTQNYMADGWDNYYKDIKLAHSPEILSQKVPFECSYAANGDSNELCRYIYDKGYQIKLNYSVANDKGEMPQGDDYTKYYYIGQSEPIKLPTPTVKDATKYEFGGWYSQADCKGNVITSNSIDTSKSSLKNKTQLYACWVEVEQGGE